MTRGVRLTVRGDLGGAVRYNPASPVLVVGALIVLARQLYGRVTGRWAELRLARRWVVATALLLVAVLEVNQQLHAALLVAR